MHVETGFQSIRMQECEELRGVRKEEFVPGVAGPSETMIRLVRFAFLLELIDIDVPIHVDHEDVQWSVILAKSADNFFNLLIAVGPVA